MAASFTYTDTLLTDKDYLRFRIADTVEAYVKFYDEELDRVFVNEFKKQLRQDIEVREVDADLEAPEFAQAMVEAFDEVMVP